MKFMLLGSFAPSLLNFRASLIKAAVAGGHVVYAGAPAMTEDTKLKIAALGAEPVNIELSRSSLNPVGDLGSLRSLRRIMRRIEPDVLIPYTIKPVIWGTLAAHSVGVKRIVPLITGLGFAFSDGAEVKRVVSRNIASVLYRLALGRADTVLFQNPDDEALFRKLRILPSHVPSAVINGSGIDLVHFAPVPLPDRPPSFLMIARLLADKGVRQFGEAARIMKERYPETAFRLVGYLDESPNSIKQVELDAIISSGVEFLGRLDDVRPAIARSNVYVLPSFYREGTPRSVLEAMAMGRAIITTDAPGCRETVVHECNGFLVPVRDSQALAAAMERFVLDPSLAGHMGAQSRRIAEEKYDVDLVNSEIMRHAGL